MSNASHPYVVATNAALGEALTTVATYSVNLMDRITVEIAVTGFALDQFVIQGLVHNLGSYQTLYSTSLDYTSPAELLVGTSGDLTIIAAATSGHFIMDVSGYQFIRIRAASSNAAGSGITLYASAK
jgi:hypothetical protein